MATINKENILSKAVTIKELISVPHIKKANANASHFTVK